MPPRSPPSRLSRGPTASVRSVVLPVEEELRVPYDWSLSGQHTLTWTTKIRCTIGGKHNVTLPAGSCNLYTYPSVHWKEGSAIGSEALDGDKLDALVTLFTAIVTADDAPEGSAETTVAKNVFDLPDASGATPILALFVANTPRALELCLALYKLKPSLLAHDHYPGPFVGENAFHIAAVNRREDELCTMIQIAHAGLDEKTLKKTLKAQAAGVFFSALPTKNYGGTPLAYACCFCLRRAVTLMLSLSAHSRKLNHAIALNDRKQACSLTGFLPLHAVVANGRRAMYDFLVELPGHPELAALRANEDGVAQAGQHALMTPLQLATFLGDHSMARHILMRRSEVVWKWGPITQFKISLGGIDSTGGHGNDVMEIIGRLDASKATREMLLDSFMQGFLHGLFVSKWQRFGRVMHYLLFSLHFAFILAVTTLAAWLKEYPDACLDNSWLQVAVLVLAVPMLEEDARSLLLYWSKLRSTVIIDERTRRKAARRADSSSRRVSLLTRAQQATSSVLNRNLSEQRTQKLRKPLINDLRLTLEWAGSHLLISKFVGALLASAVAIALLRGYRPRGATPAGAASTAAAQLAAAPPPPGVVDLSAAESSQELPFGGSGEQYFPMWGILSIALLIEIQAFSSFALVPFQTLGVYFHCSIQVIRHDIAIFIALFFVFFFTYGMAMYVCYPRAGAYEQPYAPNFNSLSGSVFELVELALTGEPIKISMLEGQPVNFDGWVGLVRHAATGEPLSGIGPDMTPAEVFEIGLFCVLYFTYVLLALILLLNLLIASMNNTFISVQAASVLEWRVLYARNLLRLEMLAEKFCDTNGGTKEVSKDEGVKWYFFTKHYETVEDEEDEGGGSGGASAGAFGRVGSDSEQQAMDMAIAIYGHMGGNKLDANRAASQIQRLYRRKRIAERDRDDLKVAMGGGGPVGRLGAKLSGGGGGGGMPPPAINGSMNGSSKPRPPAPSRSTTSSGPSSAPERLDLLDVPLSACTAAEPPPSENGSSTLRSGGIGGWFGLGPATSPPLPATAVPVPPSIRKGSGGTPVTKRELDHLSA